MHTVIFSYIFVPLSTLYLARGTDLFATNFSSISISRSRQAEFLLWCLLTGGYFFVSLKRILQGAGRSFPVRMEAGILSACAWTAGLFVLLPYLPSRFPLLSALHVLSALTASLAFFFCLLTLSVKVYLQRPGQGRPLLILLILTASFCCAALIATGIINTAMEICLVIAACVLIRRFFILFACA
jgi:hypothetical protein